MAVFSFIIKEKLYYEYEMGRCSALVVPNDHPFASQIKVNDTIELLCNYESISKRNRITPIYRTVLYVGPANVNDVNFNYTIISIR